jgi:dihydroorotate dehydrogenase subfamily 2
MERLTRALKKYTIQIILLLGILGFVDAFYLTYEHYATASNEVVCYFGIFSDCGRVLKSKYSEIFGIPLAVLGLIQYSMIILSSLYSLTTKNRIGKYFILILTLAGVVASTYFVYLQLFVIGSLCLYCMGSALISLTLFLVAYMFFVDERVRFFGNTTRILYKIIRPLIFLTNSDWIHERTLTIGEFTGEKRIAKIFSFFYKYEDKILRQKVLGMSLDNPVGLAAGFDYEAKLTETLSYLGFGYQTVGTVTNMPYEGNTPPRLGRLPKSKSLMVNKGFKSPGAVVIIDKLKNKTFKYPLGISIGRTNTLKLKNQKESIDDIKKAFIAFERSKVKNSYYELNISCPNLKGDITFYPPKNLEELLIEVDKLKIKKPILVKMPIEKSDKEVLAMLKVISKHSPKGVIFGNLQKDRKNPTLVQEEVKKFKTGYFSGKPTLDRSNELIELAYKNFGERFVIVGCGGVFNGEDAYKKIRLGATLIQFITGLVYEGPQVASNINAELVDLLVRDGYKNTKEAIGVDVDK